MHLLKSIRDILQENQADYHMLVLCRIHIIPELSAAFQSSSKPKLAPFEPAVYFAMNDQHLNDSSIKKRT
jgi:hypothetical protein